MDRARPRKRERIEGDGRGASSNKEIQEESEVIIDVTMFVVVLLC